jgi:hypothetical protein
MFRNWVGLLACVLALGGCGTVAPQQYYVTEAGRATDRSAAKARKQVKRPPQSQETAGVDDLATTGSSAGATPVVGSPAWDRAQSENERREQRIKDIMRICASC